MKPNKDFLVRHLFAFAVFLGIGLWFSYDAFVRYPKTDAAVLYESIERSPAPEGVDIHSFKQSKIASQKAFAFILLAIASAIGLHTAASVKSDFSFDGDGFKTGGVSRPWSDVEGYDSELWSGKGILKFYGKGFSVKLDSWHLEGVKEVYAAISARLDGATASV